MDLNKSPRIIVAGGCRTGKTTFAEEAGRALGVRPLSTDSLIKLGWSAASETSSYWLDMRGPWIVEGVAAVRAVRKWLERNGDGTPCDTIYWLTRPKVALSPGQVSMNLGADTIWKGVEGELRRRGVNVQLGE